MCLFISLSLKGMFNMKDCDNKSEKLLIPVLKNCARCNGTHEKILFKKFKNNPISRITTMWAPCPNTDGEPILLDSFTDKPGVFYVTVDIDETGTKSFIKNALTGKTLPYVKKLVVTVESKGFATVEITQYVKPFKFIDLDGKRTIEQEVVNAEVLGMNLRANESFVTIKEEEQ